MVFEELIAAYGDDASGLVVHNPANGAVVASVKTYSVDEAADIVDAAMEPMDAWARLTAKDRAAILRQWYELILASQEEIAQIITAESGKPLAEARGEVVYGASFIEWFAEEGKRLYGEVIPPPVLGKRILTLRQPVGLCAAITPWNFPIAMITRKVAPALAAGCAMICKPAEATPLTALFVERLAHQAGVPEAIFRVLPTHDPAAMGELFCTHPLIRKLSFTGSTRVGKILMKQSATTVKKVSMELGGNAPFIVFDDADIDAAVTGAMASRFRNAGQTCVCANRILVQSSVYDEFADKLTERVKALRVGDGADSETEIGPLISQAARDRVARLVDATIEVGATIRVGGPSAVGEAFYDPTVLTDVTPDMTIARTEIFGPVAPIIRFETEGEAIAVANDTPYGLAAYFYTNDLARSWRVLEALEYGMVGVNEGVISTEVAPFGGVKESGIGREGARAGIEEYTEIKYGLIGGLAA